MEKQRYIGVACAIVSEIFDIAYLINGIIVGGFNADMAVSTAQTLIQLILVVFMLIGFFAGRKHLLFGTVMVSMAYNGISFLLDDVAETFPMDQLFTNYNWAEGTYRLVYYGVDLLWVLGIILVFAATFGKQGHYLVKPGIVFFFVCGSALLVNVVFSALSMGLSSSSDPSGILSCLGDAFALFEYALAMGYCFPEGQTPAKGEFAPDAGDEISPDVAPDESDALLK